VSEYHRPVVLISTRDGLGKGSGRSVEGFNLYRGLTASADTLESFGGHAMAAGLSIKTENIAAFKAAFEKSVAAVLTAAAPAPETCIDGVLGLDQITDQLITDIESLQPFGAENSEPLFLARNVRVAKSQIVGGHHRRMLLCQSGANRHIPAIQFDIDPGSCLPERLPQIVYRLRWNRWNDKKVAQLLLEDFDAAPV
jgi:single-stranded-DNA-specific exonuclease